MASPHKEPKSFRTLLDLFFRWQRAHYHLWNIKLSREGTPDRIQRTADRSSRSHLVAEPNDTTRARMETNARSWAKNSRDTMEIHYRQTIQAMIPSIMGADHNGWDGPWKIATRWMENRYKNKFNVEILDWARRELAPFRKEPPTEIPSTTQTQKCPSPNNPETATLSEPPTKLKSPRSQTKNKTPSKKISPTEIKTTTADQDPRKTPKKRQLLRVTPSPPDHQQPRVKKPRTPSMERKAPKSHQSPSNPTPPMQHTQAKRTLFVPHHPTYIPIPGEPSARPRSFPAQVAGPSNTLPLETNNFTRHEHYGNKTLNWSLRPNRPFLILGDSNLSRLPRIYHGEVQVDCYPGAKLHHGIHILKHKTPVSPNVRTVILSFGTNNWAQNNSSLIQQNVGDLFEIAQSTFPNAKIHS